MTEIPEELNDWLNGISKLLVTFPHGDRICKIYGECSCGQEITMQAVMYKIAELSSAYQDACQKLREAGLEESKLGGHYGE